MSISLTADQWEHIIINHKDMASYFEAVKLIIEDPDEIYFDEWSTQRKTPGAWVEAYYKRHVLTEGLQDKMLYVSVKFMPAEQGTPGYVQTALPNRRVSGRMILKWKK